MICKIMEDVLFACCAEIKTFRLTHSLSFVSFRTDGTLKTKKCKHSVKKTFKKINSYGFKSSHHDGKDTYRRTGVSRVSWFSCWTWLSRRSCRSLQGNRETLWELETVHQSDDDQQEIVSKSAFIDPNMEIAESCLNSFTRLPKNRFKVLPWAPWGLWVRPALPSLGVPETQDQA